MKALKGLLLGLLMVALFTYEVWMGGILLMWLQNNWLSPVFHISPFDERSAVYSTLLFMGLISWHFTGKWKLKKNKLYSKKKGFNGKNIFTFAASAIAGPLVAWGYMWLIIWIWK